MGPYARGWALAMPCWRVLQQGNELIVFRVVSTIGVLIVTASLVVPGFLTGLWQGVADNGAGAGLWRRRRSGPSGSAEASDGGR